MYGSVIRWFFKSLAGINPDTKNRGNTHIIIKPTICSDLRYVKAEYNSLFGEVSSEWNIKDGEIDFNIEIPANTSATVYLPCNNTDMIEESSIKIEDNDSILSMEITDEMTAVEIGSGQYHFVIRNL